MTSRSSEPSSFAAGTELTKSMVLAMRATAPLAVSQAICTWRASGNMSAIRRRPPSTAGSSFFASACACALSRMAERLRSVFAKRGALAWYIEIFIAFLRGGRNAILAAAASRAAPAPVLSPASRIGGRQGDQRPDHHPDAEADADRRPGVVVNRL